MYSMASKEIRRSRRCGQCSRGGGVYSCRGEGQGSKSYIFHLCMQIWLHLCEICWNESMKSCLQASAYVDAFQVLTCFTWTTVSRGHTSRWDPPSLDRRRVGWGGHIGGLDFPLEPDHGIPPTGQIRQKKALFKGTVARDFWPLVFFMNRPHMGP